MLGLTKFIETLLELITLKVTENEPPTRQYVNMKFNKISENKHVKSSNMFAFNLLQLFYWLLSCVFPLTSGIKSFLNNYELLIPHMNPYYLSMCYNT